MSPIILVCLYLLLSAHTGVLMGLCLRRSSHLTKKRGVGLFTLYFLLCLLPIAGAFLPESEVKFVLQAAGDLWLGFFLYFAFLLTVLFLLPLPFRALPSRKGKRSPRGSKERTLGLSLLLAFLLFSYGLFHAVDTRVVHQDLTLSSQGDKKAQMTIVLIADLHLSVNTPLSMTERMVELVNAQDPDAVLIAGDIFTSSYRALHDPAAFARVLRNLHSRYGVYAVYGNHDVEETLFGGFPISPVSEAFRSKQMEDFFDEAGFLTLTDEHVLLGDVLTLAGRLDGQKAGDGTTHRQTPKELLEGLSDHPILVLEHEPMEYAALKQAGADLVLSGHTHNGQMFPGNLIVPFFNENAYGYKRLHDLDTYVTSGVGTYGPPLRIGTNSEIAVLHLSME